VAAVQKTLAATKFDFPLMILQPSGNVTLKGGGTSDFGGTKAAFTQWIGNGTTYTLFQFNAVRLGAPRVFYPVIESPEPARGPLHYQVFLFSGKNGQCGWAVVMEADNVPNPFEQYQCPYDAY
jgi:hypothetical protein